MAIDTQLPQVPHFVHASPTREELDWANLAAIDLSIAKTHEGRKSLVKQVHDAIKNDGFLYVVNHGVDSETITRMFDLANYASVSVSDDEKFKYDGRMRETGTYRGYKLRKFWHIVGGVRDQIEQYNMNFREIRDGDHPAPLRPFLPEIDDFAKQIHSEILNTVLRLIALSLELDEEYFIQMHDPTANAETFLRFVKYFPHPEEEEKQAGGVWLKGHTGDLDYTTQPVSALQILTKQGDWKWVRHIENGVLINIGDAVEFLTGGYYKATIHRVRQPPPDQHNVDRVGLIYFCNPHDDVSYKPIAESPVLQRTGTSESESRLLGGSKFPTAGEYRKARISAYGGTQPLQKGAQKGVDEEIVGGVLLRHYN
ncbi:hypothetical protein NP233_g6790 [Leucocoprinus birnbaumii]|uniref:Clavaminate synthase-like protein n=1 Tax=Leucocoprinus birnbaumii TaxID=56174 RepID=A0AAD5YVF4_9AGAR|nr:hypothetical protein NP233_g6790 [Leucocoprinus birnbaumii]